MGCGSGCWWCGSLGRKLKDKEMCSHLLAVREAESLRGKILNKNKIETMGKKRLTECLVKVVKKCFLKKLSVWLALIKVVVCVVNYQKWQCICKELSKRTFKVSKKIIFFFTNIK